MANTIARLGVRLAIDSAEFSKGIEAAKKDLAEFATQAKTYAQVGAASFVAMTYKALEFADAITDVAKANDVAIGTVLKLSEALQQNGGNAENASKMLSSFTAFVDKAATGSFEAQKSFKDVGISLKDLGNMSMEQLLAKTFKGLEKMPDTLTQNARAMEMFGKAVKGVAIGDLARDMEEVSHITEQQIKSIKDAGDAWDLLQKRTHDTMVTFTAFIGTPALALVEYLGTLPKLIDKVAIAWDNLGNSINLVNRLAYVLITRDFKELEKIVADYKRIKEEIEEKQKVNGGYVISQTDSDTSVKRKTKLGVDAEAVKLAALALHNNRIINKDLQEQDKLRFETLKKEVEAYHTVALRQMAEEKSLKDQQAMFELGIKGLHMRQEDVQLEKDLYEIESNRAEKMKAISRDTILDKESKEELLKSEQALADEAERLARARNQATKAIREGSFGQGFNMAMADYFRNAQTELEHGQQAFEAVMGNMNAALDNFVRTGKISFKSLASSIIQDIIAIQLKAQALSIFKSISGSGMFDFLTPQGNAGGYSTSMAQFADGGSPPVGQASLVGERGPELFVPKTAGTIIPNNMLGSMGSNQPSITYNGPYIANMSAIDTQSATQFLAKNKSAVWAANQTAQRSLPQSR